MPVSQTPILEERLRALSLGDLLILHNSVAPLPVARFYEGSTAARRVLRALEARELDFLVGPDGPVAVPAREAPAAIRDDRVITVICAHNPKRPGSRAHDRWELYRDGMTVGEYAAAVAAAGLVPGRGRSRRDAEHDYARGWISLSGPRPPLDRHRI